MTVAVTHVGPPSTTTLLSGIACETESIQFAERFPERNKTHPSKPYYIRRLQSAPQRRSPGTVESRIYTEWRIPRLQWCNPQQNRC